MSIPLITLGIIIAIPVFLLRLIIRFISLGSRFFFVRRRTQTPNCLQDPSLGDHKYVMSGNVKLHYVESGDKEKPLILFVHGFPEFWYSWRHQITHFQKDFHVVAIDMRGYSDSDKPSGVESYFLPLLVNDIKVLADHLGYDKFHLVGHDWGGAVSWTFAALHPDRLDSLVTCNIPHPQALHDSWLGGSGWEQKLKSWYILFFQCPIIPELNCLAEDMAFFKRLLYKDAGLEGDEELLEAYKYAFRDFQTWNRSINYYRSFVRNEDKIMTDYGAKLRDIKVPTLAIFGTADTALSVSAARDSAKYVRDYKLELLEGISHWVQQQAPEDVNRLIEDFIKN